jgi:hypothetical protein
MKRVFYVVLALMLVVSGVSCQKEAEPKKSDNTTSAAGPAETADVATSDFTLVTLKVPNMT